MQISANTPTEATRLLQKARGGGSPKVKNPADLDSARDTVEIAKGGETSPAATITGGADAIKATDNVGQSIIKNPHLAKLAQSHLSADIVFQLLAD